MSKNTTIIIKIKTSRNWNEGGTSILSSSFNEAHSLSWKSDYPTYEETTNSIVDECKSWLDSLGIKHDVIVIENNKGVTK